MRLSQMLAGGRHYLVVTGAVGTPERDYDVEHPRNCPYEETSSFLDPGPPVRHYECSVGRALYHVGLEDSVDINLETLDPGRYQIDYWSVKQRGGPWGPPEYDGGLTVRVEED